MQPWPRPTGVRSAIWAACALLCALPLGMQQAEGHGISRIKPGSNRAARLQAGQVDRWAVKLRRGHFFRFQSPQASLDLSMRLLRPDSTVYAAVDLTAPPEPETLIGIADAEGNWILEVRAFDKAASGRYRLSWRKRRISTRQDRLEVDAQTAWLEALDLEGQGDTAGALLKMRQSVELFEALDAESMAQVDRLDYLAGALLQSGDLKAAEQTAQGALELIKRIQPKDWRRLTSIREKLAVAAQRQKDFTAAVHLFQQNIETLQEHPASPPERLAEAFGALGGVFYQQAIYDQAGEALQQAAEVLRGRDQSQDALLATVLNNLAAIHETVADFPRAEQTYREALDLRESLFGREHEEVAITLNNLAFLYERQARYDEAIALLKRSTAILEKRLGRDDPQLGVALNNLAAIHKNQGHYEEAERLYLRVEEIFRRSYGDKHPDTAGVQGNLGNLYMVLGRYAEAEPRLRAAGEILQELLGDHPLTANAFSNWGDLYRAQGNYRESENLFLGSLAIYRRVFAEGAIETFGPRNNLGSQYVEQGRFAEAERVFSQLVRLAASSLGPNHPFVATTWNNLGNVYLEQGRDEDAEDAFSKAKAIWLSNYGEQHFQVAISAHNLARLYLETGRLQAAEREMSQALEIRRAIFGENHPDFANSLTLRAELALQRRDASAAIADLESALEITRDTFGTDHPLIGVAENYLGRALLQAGRPNEARRRLRKAIEELSEAGSYPESLIQSYSALARLEKAAGNGTQAMDLLASGLELAERLRPQIGGGAQTRAEFFDRVADQFQLMVEWQLEAGSPEAAFDYAERSRARALLDQLSLSGVDLRHSLPAGVREELLQRELQARAAVAEFQKRIRVLRAQRELASDSVLARLAALRDGLRSADREYQRVYEELKSFSPIWSGLITRGGETASLQKVLDELPQESALLLYQIGQTGSYLFLVSRDAGVTVLPLSLPSAANKAGVRPGPLTAAKLSRILNVETNMVASTARLSQFPNLLELLAKVLVPPSAWRRLENSAEVIVIPHGLLHFLPFEMLILRFEEGSGEPVYWLDEGPAIRYASSATTLLNLQQRGFSSGSGLLSLSDPVFGTGPAPPTPELEAGQTSRGMLAQRLVELPGSRRETERILGAFPDAVVLQQESATESDLRRSVSGRTYLHLATHGLVDERRNTLFSALALAQPSSGALDSRDDGLLQLYEIYELDLSATELAVLSACQTNVGNQVNGDGVFGLSRGFLAAGSRRVIASQWRVDDNSTAELIGTFFEKLASARKSGETIDYARLLHEAKQAVRRQTGWSEPYFWAPFILLGAR